MMDKQIETHYTNRHLCADLHDSEEPMRDFSKREWLQEHAPRILEPWPRWPIPFNVARIDTAGQIEENIADNYEDAINLRSDFEWLTCHIWLPEGYNVADVDPDTILLNGEIGTACFETRDELQTFIAKFAWSHVEQILRLGEVEFTVSGRLFDGTPFEGSVTLSVIDEREMEQQKKISGSKRSPDRQFAYRIMNECFD